MQLAPTKTKLKIQLTTPQAQFLDSRAPFCGFCGGRGAGKSWIGAYKRIKRAKPNRTYMILAPTYPMLRDATVRTFKSVLRMLNQPFQENKGDGVITLQNGAAFLLRTANEPDRLRGPNLSGAWGDEASIFTEEVYEILIPALREGGEQGNLDLTFTPKGKAHWTYKRLRESKDADCELIHSHTKENPFLPPGFAATIARQYGELLGRQELGGEFLEMGDTWFPSRYFEGNDFWFGVWPLPNRIKARVLFYDGAGKKGTKHSDWHAAALLAIDQDGHLWFRVHLWKGPYEFAAKTLVDLAKAFNPDACGVESNFGGEIMIPLIQRAATDASRPDLAGKWLGVPSLLTKEDRIRRLGPYLENSAVHLMDDPGGRETLRQLEQFPLCDHDDGPDAMDGAVQLAAHLFR